MVLTEFGSEYFRYVHVLFLASGFPPIRFFVLCFTMYRPVFAFNRGNITNVAVAFGTKQIVVVVVLFFAAAERIYDTVLSRVRKIGQCVFPFRSNDLDIKDIIVAGFGIVNGTPDRFFLNVNAITIGVNMFSLSIAFYFNSGFFGSEIDECRRI